MQSLGSNRPIAKSADQSARSGNSRHVLPRVMRKPFRIFSRLGDSGYRTPRSVWAILFVAVFVVSGFSGWVSNSGFPVQYSKVSADAGFVVSELRVSGGDHVSPAMIRDALADQLQKPLFEFDVEVARKRVENIPWIKTAVVSKTYPDIVSIDLQEREALAVWQTDGNYKLIDRQGIVMTNLGGSKIDDRYLNLPLVVGDGANLAVNEFLDAIAGFPMLAARSIAYVRVGDRRWDLTMEDGVTIMLPEVEVTDALTEIHRLQGEFDVLDRDLSVIDMRLPDRLVLRLAEGVAKERREQLEERIKQAKALEVKT